ncbi:PKD domain-containing protein [Lysobacter korlensis]|uniref:PKD domain-containing protein n=1 Tax=Lysobacter korlensis TaxID=553636 RepID=A0ABV6RP12_9GAMM
MRNPLKSLRLLPAAVAAVMTATLLTGVPPAPAGAAAPVLAADSFSRTVTGGLGTAETGGTWSTSAASAYAVNGSTARVTTARSTNRLAHLSDVSSTETELRTAVAFARPTSSSVYVGVVGRRIGTATYGARVVVGATGAPLLQLQRNTGVILGSARLSGLNFSSGDQLQFRLQVVGTNPTSLRVKVWETGTTEPAEWQATATDSTTTLQQPGTVGLYSYLGGAANPSSIVVSYDDFSAVSTAAPPPPPPPPANQFPTASFTMTQENRTVSLRGSASDPDGEITEYRWNLGDGTTASGQNVTHTYAAPGRYLISLTVHDDADGSGGWSREVRIVDESPDPSAVGALLAADSFERTASGGLGTAETGGSWTANNSSGLSVSGGEARISLAPYSRRTATLNGVRWADTEVRAAASFVRPTSGSVYVGVIGRSRGGTPAYGARVVVGASGAPLLQLHRDVDTVLRSFRLTSVSFASGDELQFKVRVTGLSPSTVQAKVWESGTAEPADWQVTASDAVVIQDPGGVGLSTYLSGSATPSTQVVRFDDFSARSTSDIPPPPPGVTGGGTLTLNTILLSGQSALFSTGDELTYPTRPTLTSGIEVRAAPTATTGAYSVRISPAYDAPLTEGHYRRVSSNRTDLQPAVQISVGTQSYSFLGDLDILDIQADAWGNITAFDIVFGASDTTPATQIWGQFRLGQPDNPTYALAARQISWPHTPAGVQEPTYATQWVRNISARNIAIGQASVSAGTAGDYSIAADACSGRTLAPGATCTLRVGYQPDGAGARNATLTVPIDGTVERVALNAITRSGASSITIQSDDLHHPQSLRHGDDSNFVFPSLGAYRYFHANSFDGDRRISVAFDVPGDGEPKVGTHAIVERPVTDPARHAILLSVEGRSCAALPGSSYTVRAYELGIDGAPVYADITFTVYCQFGAGKPSTGRIEFRVRDDVQAPAQATGVTVTGSGTSRTVSWTPSTAADLAHSVVRLVPGNAPVNSATAGYAVYTGTGRSAPLPPMRPGKKYQLQVYSVDETGNVGEPRTLEITG